jgi:hypothetical protein
MSWSSTDSPTSKSRLNALAASAAFVGPHKRGLDTLMLTDDDVTALRPPDLAALWRKQLLVRGHHR